MTVDLHPSVAERLERLAPDQRAAAIAEPGPILCVAPAGSGKTTTLVARVAWLIASGAATADEIAAITFNKRAAEELSERLAAAFAPLDAPLRAVRVRTFHALGLEILRDAGLPVQPLVDRMAILRRVAPAAGPAGWRSLDTAISRLKLDLGVTADEVAADDEAGPIARTFVAYEAAVAETGGLDFDDLVARALRALEADAPLLARWRRRCAQLLVDEAQDLDRAQLRLALFLASPANRIFLVGDDDQSIYGWRLADVRRVLALGELLPGLRRIDLEVNYRCPPTVVRRAVRLVEHNRERFAKVIRAGPAAAGPLVLAADASDETVRIRRVIGSWPDDDATRAILARTNRELLPAISVALDLGAPFRPPAIELLVSSPFVDRALDEAETSTDPGLPALARLETVRARWAASPPQGGEDADDADGADHTDGPDDPDAPRPADIAAALIAWAVPYPDLRAVRAAVAARRVAIVDLCRDDAALTLATAHGTKGLEFDHVAVIGLDAGRFPSRRSVAESTEPARALEEERRLAYVAWTRARRSLTLVYDPAAPSAFMLEAFDPNELGLEAE
ncbi:MAG TPA: ATP-dependent helicase [Candidatus Limnocylindrales bacterium]|jgi:superfamily I DNA/RNA helicase|nr:ATP-dependent helicase [Candidatus Limnocylindrales bacterium]